MFNVFNTLTLKQVFWKTETFFRKLEHRFLIESAMIEIATIPFKLPYQKPMLLRGTKWTYLKDRGFALTTYCFWYFNSSIKT